LLLDPPSRAIYSTDASLFQVEPLAVAMPRDEDDLALLLRYAYERSIPIIPRGAGTGIAGESLGYGIVVDLSVHFRSIVEVGDDWVRAQSGVVLDQLNSVLAARGRRFAPDPASGRSCTIGGMVATNATGGRAAIHGSTREHVLGMRVVWDDGTLDRLSEEAHQPTDRGNAIRHAVQELAQSNRELIAAHGPRFAFDRCGYWLRENADLARLLVGSEGTLAVTTEAKLRTIPLAGGRAAVMFGFSTFDAALQAGLRIRETHPSACELLDRRLLSLARAKSQGFEVGAEIEAALFVEYERDTPTLAADAVRAVSSTLHDVQRSAELTIPALDSTSADELWAIRGSALPSLYAIGKGRRPLAFVEDMGIPPDRMPALIHRANAILKRFDVSASFLIHIATGQLHLRPFLDPNDPDDAARLWPLAEELHGLVIDMGGTVSAQHGTGIARTPWVARQLGPLFPVLQELKRVFDPRGILNPGKIVGPDPSRPAWPLRSARDSAPTTENNGVARVTPLLLWQADEMTSAVAACNGCGACRTEEPAKRMCPTFHATNNELASPRAKANLFRSLLEGKLTDANEQELRSVADFCVNCKMCAIECPGKADIPKLMLEAKAANHATLGWRRSTWFLARMDGLAGIGSKFALTSNLLLRRPTIRWILEKIFGLSRRRTLPAFAFRSFLARARGRGLTKRSAPTPGVAYFVDTFANVFDPSLAEATVAVLRHNGVPVYVPARQRGCGAMALAHGDVDVARERLARNIRVLADCARNGDTIVCSEPTAALFFRLDSQGLLDDPDARLVAEKTVELTSYLWTLYQESRLRTDFQTLELQIGHHVPCHMKALNGGIHGPELLKLIPGLDVNKIDVSCSGMAGTYGLNAKNYSVSMAAGRPMLEEFARPRHLFGSSECSACRMQMQESAGKRALHPVQYLAMAYGLMPKLAERLRRPVGKRVSV
jgi:FAD/FMN-containing dehydrogenase/Fe-S oxidoreductase